MFMSNATRKQRARAEKNRNGARSDYWELQFLCHSRRGPRYLKRAATLAERRLAQITIQEGLES